MITPRVTVLMPVFNAGSYLEMAVRSILSQTFTNFEFLIIDDGSTDGSLKKLENIEDTRVRVESNHTNLGLVYSLNRGIQLSRGEYIARMDGDDFSLPERLAIQVAFMDGHPEVGICGSWIRVMGSMPEEIWRYPEEHDAIRSRLLFDSALAHPTAMLRRSVLLSHALRYDATRPSAEDYAFWLDCSQHTRLANLPCVLLEYRLPADRPKLDAYQQQQQATADQVRLEQLLLLGIDASPAELTLHRDIALHRHLCTEEYIENSRAWLERILVANQKRKVLAEEALERELGNTWLEVCHQAKRLGTPTWHAYRHSHLRAGLPKSSPSHWMFLCLCMLAFAKSRISRVRW